MQRADSQPSPEPQHYESFDDLIKAARAGSRQALGDLFDRYRRYLILVAEREFPPQLRAKESPSDIVQDTFLDAQAGFAGFRGLTEHEFYAWLRRALLRRVIKSHRRYQRTEKRDIRHEECCICHECQEWHLQTSRRVTTPSAYAVADEKQWQICQALDQLADDYRQVILLHHRDGFDFNVVAVRMSRSEAAVRKLWTRAIKQLQVRLEEMDGSGYPGAAGSA